MNDLQYIFNLICQRRGKALKKVESVAGNFIIAFGVANATELLPATTNVFYYVKSLFFSGTPTGIPALDFSTPAAGPSAGNNRWLLNVNTNGFLDRKESFECDSLFYTVNTHSAGNLFFWGTVFKITYS